MRSWSWQVDLPAINLLRGVRDYLIDGLLVAVWERFL